MTAEQVRMGLVGYGFGGRNFHAPLLASAPSCDFAGVVTTSASRRAELARDHPGVRAYDSLEALAADGAVGVAISTPARTHASLALRAISLGMAVVVDKPFAMSTTDAREVIAAADTAGVALSVYQNRRWDSDFLTLRKLLREGRLGDIQRFGSTFERFATEPAPPEAGGGILRDFGSHLVDQALLLFGQPTTVYAEMRRTADVVTGFFATLQHANGVRSHLSGEWREGAPAPRLRVSGTEGSFVVPRMDGQERLLVGGRSPASEGDGWGREDEADWGWVQRGDSRDVVPSERGRWDTYYPAFAAAVRGEREVPVDPADAVLALEVIEAAERSAAERVVVAVTP
jgi:predicted dehydrogenase